MFDRVGQVVLSADAGDADTVFEAALEAGAQDVVSSDSGHEIVCEIEDLNEVSKALEARFGEPEESKMIWKPQTLIFVEGDTAESLFKLLDNLDDNDDVQNVYANYDVSDETMASLSD